MNLYAIWISNIVVVMAVLSIALNTDKERQHKAMSNHSEWNMCAVQCQVHSTCVDKFSCHFISFVFAYHFSQALASRLKRFFLNYKFIVTNIKMSASPVLVSYNKSFGGEQRIYSHFSRELQCPMRFAIYLPESCSIDNPLPVVYWLSGLTCTETNFIEKAGAQKYINLYVYSLINLIFINSMYRYASDLGLVIVCPDTSPRGVNLPGEDESYDFGSGAGFYVDATQEPWSKHYRMFSYVTVELIELITGHFPVVAGKQSIAGHSMGGHGALVCALRSPGLYQSVSAFAPICHPSKGAWGRKALTGYLGSNEGEWSNWDATQLIAQYKSEKALHLLVDQVEYNSIGFGLKKYF